MSGRFTIVTPPLLCGDSHRLQKYTTPCRQVTSKVTCHMLTRTWLPLLETDSSGTFRQSLPLLAEWQSSMMALPDSRKSPLWDCVAWFVCLCLLYLYRRRQQVQLWIHTQWIALEDVLRIEMSKVMGQELRAVVTVEKLELRATGVAMHRLVMEDAECAAYIESLNFET